MNVISNCEKQFVSNIIIKRQKRLDGRELKQGRKLEIVFGKERGCCIALQGNTRVLVHVSCYISEPKPNTPIDGMLIVNFEFTPKAVTEAKTFSRTSEEFVEAQRVIERCIRETDCLEREALCIIPESKVWTVKIDIKVLNDDGNVTECATIAAISALKHFRLPDLIYKGTDVTVCSLENSQLVALKLKHIPICVNLALFGEGKSIVIDPTAIEEKVCDGCYVYVLNSDQDIFFVHRRGILRLKEDVIRRIDDLAIKRVQEVTKIIISALDDDTKKTEALGLIALEKLFKTKCETSADSLLDKMINDTAVIESMVDVTDSDESEEPSAGNRVIGDTVQIKSEAKEKALRILQQESESAVFEGGRSKWGCDTDASSEDEVPETKPDISMLNKQSSSDSEEEIVYVAKEQLDKETSDRRGWFVKDPFA